MFYKEFNDFSDSRGDHVARVAKKNRRVFFAHFFDNIHCSPKMRCLKSSCAITLQKFIYVKWLFKIISSDFWKMFHIWSRSYIVDFLIFILLWCFWHRLLWSEG